MTDTSTEQQNTQSEANGDTIVFHVGHSPHIANLTQTTRRMMLDVIIALVPVMAMAIYVFRLYAVKQLAICLAASLAAEAVFMKMRGKKITLDDGSAAITGLILGLSIPGTAPWFVGVIGSVVAIGIGKTLFGGLGMNIFNPAMVGRAFVMIAFAGIMAASGYENAASTIDAVTQATPLNAFKQMGITTPLWDLFWGTTNGSLGETSAFACLLGGIYLCIRRTASWEIPAGVIAAVIIIGGLADVIGPRAEWTVLHHLFGGSLLFGAFYIATDPVSSPLSPTGKWVFGAGVGALIMILRLFSGYPEGVMFAVLIMNAMTPLINQWTRPRTMGEQ